jgi:hypothetical protein
MTPQASPSRRTETPGARAIRLGTFALAILGILLLIGLLPKLGVLLRDRPLSDVRAYYDAGARLNAGQPLYPADADVNASEFYRYPPLLAIAFRPLALLPFEVAAVVWEIAMIGSLVLALRLLAPPRAVTRGVAILAFPIAWSLALGQAQVVVTWLLALASPWAVALAGQLKVLPAVAALYWVGRRDWAAFRSFVLWSLGLIAAQVVVEPKGSQDFLRIANLSQVGDINNLSPYAISPYLWGILAGAGAVLTLWLGRTRYGWAAAVAFSVLATPRLISYLLMALLAALSRKPAVEGLAPTRSIVPPRSTTSAEEAAAPAAERASG